MGKGSGGSNLIKLRRRLEQFKHRESSSVDEIVHHLRNNFPDYNRIKLNELNRLVEKTLYSFDRRTNRTKTPPIPKPIILHDADGDGGGDGSGSGKRLHEIENEHIRKKHRTDHDRPSTSDGGDDAVSTTSEDAVERELDLTKSRFRARYMKSNSVTITRKAAAWDEKNKIDMISILPNIEYSEREAVSVSKSKAVSMVKGNEGLKFKDLGGMEKFLMELTKQVLVPLCHPQSVRLLGMKPMAGILLHGPPGCGKTTLAHAIANETGLPFYPISSTNLVSGVSGASEENIRELFQKAYRTAPSIVFIDEIDAIASKRENLQRQMDQRIVTQMITCMDELHRPTIANSDSQSNSDYTSAGYVLVIGATNRPDAIDPALRRPGRFSREIELGVPDEKTRAEILDVLTRNRRLEGSFDLLKIARSTAGFVRTDLAYLVDTAANLALNRVIGKSLISTDSMHEEHSKWWRRPLSPEEEENLSITMADFEQADKEVQPSSSREGFSTIPNVKWEDIGGLDSLRTEFYRHIIRRLKYPEIHEECGLDMGMGFLLYGPPGCGKTLIAKAIASEAGVNFIHIKGPEFLNKYVGESELAVRTIFRRARTCSPCILFLDEVDALTTQRGKEGGWVVERLLNQLLIELDGGDQRQGVFVIGATNRPDVMDRAVLRPGRLGKHLYVPLPGPAERGLILQALARKKPIDPSVDLNAIGRMEACKNFSGADLAFLMYEATMAAVDEKIASIESGLSTSPQTVKVKLTHFELLLTKISPTVSDEEKLYYDKLSESFKAA